MRYLIDSDWVIDFLRGRSEAADLIRIISVDGIAISIISYGEVYDGIVYGSDPRYYEMTFRRFLQGAQVLGVTQSIARRFARIRGELRRQGQSIPQPDLYIAATAIHYDLTLVTRNRRHYERIPDLKLHQTI